MWDTTKQGEEDKVNEGDEELFSKDLRIKNYDKNKSIFKWTCKYIDSVVEVGSLFRFGDIRSS